MTFEGFVYTCAHLKNWIFQHHIITQYKPEREALLGVTIDRSKERTSWCVARFIFAIVLDVVFVCLYNLTNKSRLQDFFLLKATKDIYVLIFNNSSLSEGRKICLKHFHIGVFSASALQLRLSETLVLIQY